MMNRTDVNSNPVVTRRSPSGPPGGGAARGIRALPFLSVHLGCLAAFFTGVDRPALALCARHVPRAHVRHHGRLPPLLLPPLLQDEPGVPVRPGAGSAAAPCRKGPSGGRRTTATTIATRTRPGTRTRPSSTRCGGPTSAGSSTRATGRRTGDRSPTWAASRELRWLDRNHWVPGLALAAACHLIAGRIRPGLGVLRQHGPLLSRHVRRQFAGTSAREPPLPDRRREPQQPRAGPDHPGRGLAQQPPPLRRLGEPGVLLVGDRHRLRPDQAPGGCRPGLGRPATAAGQGPGNPTPRPRPAIAGPLAEIPTGWERPRPLGRSGPERCL